MKPTSATSFRCAGARWMHAVPVEVHPVAVPGAHSAPGVSSRGPPGSSASVTVPGAHRQNATADAQDEQAAGDSGDPAAHPAVSMPLVS